MKQWILFVMLSISMTVLSQEKVSGTVSFMNKSNVYLKFDTTENLTIGSFLYRGEKACLKIINKSSSSVVCEPIAGCELKIGDVLSYQITYEQQAEFRITPEEKPELTENPIPTVVKNQGTKAHIFGRIAQSTYFTKDEFDHRRNRLRTLFSIHADELNNKRLSFDSYITYQHQVDVDQQTHRIRTNVYNLSATYQTENQLLLSLGRKINPKLSIVGAIDGLQIEKGFRQFYIGSFAGMRPDPATYGFNSALFQYGAYIGMGSNRDSSSSQTSIGLVEQTNSGLMDRQFVYAQHQSTPVKNLHLFGSMEYDIYSTTQGLKRLTNLYTSVRYRLSGGSSFMISYDRRKRIIYYETYQTEVERLLDDDLARQGIRMRLNIRPSKFNYSGLSFSNRFKSDGSYDSKNYYAYTSFTKLPYINGKLSLTATYNQSTYLNSLAYSINHSRSIFDSYFMELYFRKGIFDYANASSKSLNNYYGLSLNHQNKQLWQVGVSTELNTNSNGNGLRTYFRIAKRFK